MAKKILPDQTNNRASDGLCKMINQAVGDKTDLLVFSFGSNSMKVEYQINGLNYEVGVDSLIKNSQKLSVVSSLQDELENWLSESIIQETKYKWKRPLENPDKYGDRVNLAFDSEPILNLELNRIKTINDTIYLFRPNYRKENLTTNN